MTDPIRFGGLTGGPAALDENGAVSILGTYYHYVLTVWIPEHAVPTDPAAVRAYDPMTLYPFFLSYMQSGGTVDLGRGATLEDTWLGLQLLVQEPFTCLLSTDQPEQETARITRLRRLAPGAILHELARHVGPRVRARENVHAQLQRRAADGGPVHVLTYDGETGHCIVVVATDPSGHFVFFDPWPGASLLAAGENAAGVAAEPMNADERYWRIAPADFARVLFAAFPPL